MPNIKKTVRFAEKLVSAEHEPKVYGPSVQDSELTGRSNKQGGNEAKESEEIDFSALDFDDPRRIWAEIKATLPVLPETTPTPGDKKDKAKDPKAKKDKSDRKKDSKGEKEKSSSRSKDSKAEKEKSSSGDKAPKDTKGKSSTATETKVKKPNWYSNNTVSQQNDAENSTPNLTISWDFWADEKEDTPKFNAVSRTAYGIGAYPMDLDYTPPANQSHIGAGEERGYQYGDWMEDIPYTAGENEGSEGLGFAYGSRNWRRERSAYGAVWGHVEEAGTKEGQ